jgi:hypothetical protein
MVYSIHQKQPVSNYMINTMLSFEQQLTRFERHHKKICPIACDYTREGDGFADAYINSVFLGWSMAVTAQHTDEVDLSYDHTDGWRVVSSVSGFTVRSPQFKPYSTLADAVEWVKEQGLLIVNIQD